MDIKEIVDLHARAKKPLYLGYKRKSGRKGHCYIDPSKPLLWKIEPNNYRGYEVTGLDNLYKSKDCQVQVFKSVNDVEIYVKPEDLFFQSERREAVSKILYGKNT